MSARPRLYARYFKSLSNRRNPRVVRGVNNRSMKAQRIFRIRVLGSIFSSHRWNVARSILTLFKGHTGTSALKMLVRQQSFY